MNTDTQSRLPTVKTTSPRPLSVRANLELAEQRYKRGMIGWRELKAAEAAMVQLRAEMIDAAAEKGRTE